MTVPYSDSSHHSQGEGEKHVDPQGLGKVKRLSGSLYLDEVTGKYALKIHYSECNL